MTDEDKKLERCYRQGYHQGVAAAMRTLQDGATLPDIELWERKVRIWRTDGQNASVRKLPPAPSGRANG